MKAEVRRDVFLSAVWAFLSLFWLYAVLRTIIQSGLPTVFCLGHLLWFFFLLPVAHMRRIGRIEGWS